MPEFKRPAEMALMPTHESKRARTGEVAEVSGPPRTSHLQSPIMLLNGHEGEIYGGKFSPDGTCLASVGFDMRVFLWNVFGECENFSCIKGHTGAIMEVHFAADSSMLFTASTDKTVRVWDMETGACVRKFRGHTNFVNSCFPARRGPQLVCSGSDDGTVKVWDTRKREAVTTLPNTYQLTAVTFNDTSEQVISGGIDNDLKIWDLRKNDVFLAMRGHSDTVTGLSLSPDGSYVLSNSMDCSVKIWDIRPFGPPNRCVKSFTGHQHNFEKASLRTAIIVDLLKSYLKRSQNLLRCSWSPGSDRVTAGSSDRFVYVWDVASSRIVYKLPGHQGSVNETNFHPNEPILMSVGSDKRIYLGEIQ
uniref:U5 small nuclear ribonucleoprotein 40 kDa protein n=1 Tax=Plectus sambesii TaxID=2011161 RepID=A0A914VXZ9_9BILA